MVYKLRFFNETFGLFCIISYLNFYLLIVFFFIFNGIESGLFFKLSYRGLNIAGMSLVFLIWRCLLVKKKLNLIIDQRH